MDGVLGGFGTISPNDLKHSKSFLMAVFGDRITGAKQVRASFYSKPKMLLTSS